MSMRRKIVLEELIKVRTSGVSRITLFELHDMLRRCGIIATHYRKDFVMWLLATKQLERDKSNPNVFIINKIFRMD